MNISALSPILDHYAVQYQPSHVEALGSAGGFSGAAFWRLTAPRGKLCLRRWPPEHPTRERLEWIHMVLRNVSRQGIAAVPFPICTQSGRSFVPYEGCFWELTPWMPGSADYHRSPGEQKLKAAMTALARFHIAAAAIAGHSPKHGTSPGLKSRLEQIRSLKTHEIADVEQALRRVDVYGPELHCRARELLAGFRLCVDAVERDLTESLLLAVPLQICIRDIWHDHVLFTGDEVSGIIDFGAMRVETVAGDVARLLGSLAGDDRQAWQVGTDAYEATRKLSAAERQLIPVFDRSTVLISGLNWLTWIFVQRREFHNRGAIIRRLDEILVRLRRLSGA